MESNPAVPLYIPVAVLLVETLFGIGYNAWVAWVHEHRLWHVSVSVSVGVALTLVIAMIGMWHEVQPFWQASLFLLMCFTASGVPMIAGSTLRTVKESHQRRPLPNAAMHVRDDVVMGINANIEKVVKKEMEVAMLVHEMHKWIGALRSM